MGIKALRYEEYGLTPMLVRETISSILRHADPSRVILYGSRGRGDYGERSDIDLAVEGVPNPALLRDHLEDEVPTLRKFDVIGLDQASEMMRESVERDGVILYERNHPPAEEL